MAGKQRTSAVKKQTSEKKVLIVPITVLDKIINKYYPRLVYSCVQTPRIPQNTKIRTLSPYRHGVPCPLLPCGCCYVVVALSVLARPQAAITGGNLNITRTVP